MSTSRRNAIMDLANIEKPQGKCDDWDFHGETYSELRYNGDLNADLDAVLDEDYQYLRGSQTHPIGNFKLDGTGNSTAPRPHLFGNTNVASSYANTTASIKPNYATSHRATTSQDTSLVYTPSSESFENHANASAYAHISDHPMQHSYSGYSPQQSYSDFPTQPSGLSSLDSWYETHHRHEYNAYRLSDPAADPMKKSRSKEGYNVHESKQ